MPSIQKLKNAVLPTEREVTLAREAGHRLASCLGKDEVIRLHVSSSDQSIEVPARAFRMLVDLLNHMANGDSVDLVIVPAELTLQHATEFLNVSERYLHSLFEAKLIPFHLVGDDKRIHLHDLMRYKARIDRESSAALVELTDQAQKLGFGY